MNSAAPNAAAPAKPGFFDSLLSPFQSKPAATTKPLPLNSPPPAMVMPPTRGGRRRTRKSKMRKMTKKAKKAKKAKKSKKSRKTRRS